MKYTETILSNITRKLVWFEITKMLIAVSENTFIVLFCYNFWCTFVLYYAHPTTRRSGGSRGVQGCGQTPALLFRCPFLKRTYFENMSLRFLAEQGAS